MSWQAYVDDHLMCPMGANDKTLIGAAIVGHDGTIWAQSPAFPQESESVLAALCGKVTTPEGSCEFAGTRYILINSEPDVVLRGRKGANGIIVSKTKTALVVGLYNSEDVQAGDASKVVEGIGEYLSGQGL